jgi:hypothetical protein
MLVVYLWQPARPIASFFASQLRMILNCNRRRSLRSLKRSSLRSQPLITLLLSCIVSSYLALVLAAGKRKASLRSQLVSRWFTTLRYVHVVDSTLFRAQGVGAFLRPRLAIVLKHPPPISKKNPKPILTVSKLAVAAASSDKLTHPHLISSRDGGI